MKKLIIFFVIGIFFSQTSFAQIKPSFNHLTIYVVDMNKSADFYEKVIGLERIPEPFHDNRHIWEKIGEHSELHIVQGAKEITPHDINIHLAFTVTSVEAFSKHLDAMNVKYGNWAQLLKNHRSAPMVLSKFIFRTLMATG